MYPYAVHTPNCDPHFLEYALYEVWAGHQIFLSFNFDFFYQFMEKIETEIVPNI